MQFCVSIRPEIRPVLTWIGGKQIHNKDRKEAVIHIQKGVGKTGNNHI
jgi:hypothetical protein